MNELQWTNETHFFAKIYLSYFILERGTQFVVSLRDRWRDIYILREGTSFAPYLLLGARGCQCLYPFASRIVRRPNASNRLCIHGSTLDSDRPDCLNLTVWFTWSPSGYTAAQPAYPDALPSPCLLITTWQLVKAHGSQGTNPKSMSTVII